MRRSSRSSGTSAGPGNRAYAAMNPPSLLTDNLLDVIPGPVLKAYIFCARIADADGSFQVAHSTLARKIGASDRRHGERVMRRLLDAGLVRQRWRGGPGRSNGYQLAALSAVDFEATRKTLARPLTPRRPGDQYAGPADLPTPVAATAPIPVAARA